MGSASLVKAGDVGKTFKTGGKEYALGRYLTDKVRLACGYEGLPGPVRKVVQVQKLEEGKVPEIVLNREQKRINSGRRAQFRERLAESLRRL